MLVTREPNLVPFEAESCQPVSFSSLEDHLLVLQYLLQDLLHHGDAWDVLEDHQDPLIQAAVPCVLEVSFQEAFQLQVVRDVVQEDPFVLYNDQEVQMEVPLDHDVQVE
jgi:hypothetical protein